jgi:uncharacterized membrane protein YidH (DUF202 family)
MMGGRIPLEVCLIKIMELKPNLAYIRAYMNSESPLPVTNPGVAAEEREKKEFKKGKKALGMERVRLALERLQLAWLRTAFTFIGLGFTAYKVYYERIEHGQDPVLRHVNGRSIGLFLIFSGLLGLAQATLQHRKNWEKLRIYYPGLTYSVALVQSYLILTLAFFLLLVVIFEL